MTIHKGAFKCFCCPELTSCPNAAKFLRHQESTRHLTRLDSELQVLPTECISLIGEFLGYHPGQEKAEGLGLKNVCALIEAARCVD